MDRLGLRIPLVLMALAGAVLAIGVGTGIVGVGDEEPPAPTTPAVDVQATEPVSHNPLDPWAGRRRRADPDAASQADYAAALSVLDEEVERLRATGEPVTLDEIVEPLPASENGAASLLALDRWMNEHFPNDEDPEYFRTLRSEVTDAQRAEVPPYLERAEEWFRRLEEALDAPRWRFDEPLAAPIWLLQRASMSLRAEADLSDDEERSLRATRMVLAMGAKWQPVGSLELLISNSLRRGGCEMLRDQLAKGLSDPFRALQDLGPFLDSDSRDRFPVCVRGDRASLLLRIEHHLGRPGVQLPKEMPVLEGRPAVDLDGFRTALRGYFELMTEFASIDDPSYAARRDVANDIYERGGKLPNLLQDVGLSGGLAGLVVADGYFSTTDALLRLARLSLEVAAHRQRSGEWPKSLGDIADQVHADTLIDPFTDEPFLYTRIDGGVEIRSADPGADGNRYDPDEDSRPILAWTLPD